MTAPTYRSGANVVYTVVLARCPSVAVRLAHAVASPVCCCACSKDHKLAAYKVVWNANGNWMLTSSKDRTIKLYDIRVMRDMYTMKMEADKYATCTTFPPLMRPTPPSTGWISPCYSHITGDF